MDVLAAHLLRAALEEKIFRMQLHEKRKHAHLPRMCVLLVAMIGSFRIASCTLALPLKRAHVSVGARLE